jgi:hypothetical protein
MADSTSYPTLAHAFAALDGLPLAGSLYISPDDPGVDFDALMRARRILPYAWSDQAPADQIAVTPQGGVGVRWRRGDSTLEMTVDPFALVSFRMDTRSRTSEWTRATIDLAIADIRHVLGLPPAQLPPELLRSDSTPERGTATAGAPS